MTNFKTIEILEAEDIGRGRFITGTGRAMSRSIKTALRLAQVQVNTSLGNQSRIGGTPIFRSVKIDGKEVSS